MKLGIIELHDNYNFDTPVSYKQLIRCGECKHWADNEDYDCEIHSGAWQADDFCSRGERNSSEKPNNSERSSE